jgi:polar amino acid transport system permease protein
MTTWNQQLFLDILTSPLIFKAAWTTIWVGSVAQLIGTAIGIVVGPTMLSRYLLVRGATWFYLWLFRGTPLLAQILFFYAVLPLLGMRLSVLATGLLALGVNEGARMAEVVRGGLLSVPREQSEAGRALGLRPHLIFVLIVLPQAARAILAPLANNYSYMIKATSLLSVISVAELLRTSQQLAQSTVRPLEIYSAAAIWYMGMVTIIMIIQSMIERRLSLSSRSKVTRAVGDPVQERLEVSVKAEPLARDAEIVLEARAITKRLGSIVAVHDVDLAVARGEVVVVVGPSGSGKSTLLRCLNYLDIPDSGAVRLEQCLFGRASEQHPSKLVSDSELRRQRARIGMVFQRFNLFANLSALRNVAVGPERVLGARRNDAETKARLLLQRFGLTEKIDSYPSHLSGGQKQRVAIARAMAMEPTVLLFDEPTSSLDPEVVHEVLDAMRELARSGATMIVVTHEIGFARAVADRIVVMDRGRIIEHGSPHDVLERPQHPRTQQFIASLSAA